MSIHAFLDNFTVRLTALTMRGGGFFNHDASSPHISEHLAHTTIDLPNWNRSKGLHTARATGLTDTPIPLDPAFHVASYAGPNHPTIIYHHGNNERPFTTSFRFIAIPEKTTPVNIICIRAPYHAGSLRHYLTGVSTLSGFAAMMAASVSLIDALLDDPGLGRPATIAGISLGGFVANLHKAFSDRADIYVPLLAGAGLGRIFTRSIYSRLCGRAGREHPESIEAALDFDANLQARNLTNVHPLLARYDQIITFTDQSQSYVTQPVATINKGHMTGALAYKYLGNHLKSHAVYKNSS